MISRLVFPGLIFIVLLLWTANYFAYYYISPSLERLGPWGDMFGAVGALFNGLAFAAIAYNLYLQRQDMKRFHVDLELKEEELKRIRMEEKIREANFKPHFTFGPGGIADDAFNIEIKNIGPTVTFMNYREKLGNVENIKRYPEDFDIQKDHVMGFAFMKMKNDHKSSNCPFELDVNVYDQIFNIYTLTLRGTFSNWHMTQRKVGTKYFE